MTRRTEGTDRRDRAAKAGLAALAAATLLAPLAALPAAPDAPGPVLAAAPPWIDLAQAVEDAGGRAIGPALAPFAVLAASPRPGFPDRLRASGAWLTLDGRRIARLCGALP